MTIDVVKVPDYYPKKRLNAKEGYIYANYFAREDAE